MFLFVLPVWLLWLSITWRWTVRAPLFSRISLLAIITLACITLGSGVNESIIASKLKSLGTAQGIAAMQRASSAASILLAASGALTIAFGFVAFAARQRG
jgi:hypothetical protein